MIDPIGGFQRIREQYLTYLETAFRIADESVSNERRELLLRPGQMATEPFIEPTPQYKSVDWSLSSLAENVDDILPGWTHEQAAAFQRLATSGLFDSDEIKPYLHQVEMLRRGVGIGTPGIVTSGTGSGKTESFLLPIMASILREGMTKWDAPEDGYLASRWWHDDEGKPYEKFTDIPKDRRPTKKAADQGQLPSPFIPHRAGEAANRPAAVRALIMYPMNALVEDQLARIRAALDSTDARLSLDETLDGNRIFFGRYTGQTPVTGFHRHPRTPAPTSYKALGRKLRDLFDFSLDAERTQQHVSKMIESESLDPQDEFLFPSVDGSELLSRWDMQETPPDILISNITMLSAMLNREVDAPIFDKTADWLASDPDAYFYLVLDELHLHRGGAGTEVAYLVRSLLDRLGLTKPDLQHKLRILSSSASLPADGEEAKRSEAYLRDMFGDAGLGTDPDPSEWMTSIVAGELRPFEPKTSGLLDPAGFDALLDALSATDVDAAPLPESSVLAMDAVGPILATLGIEEGLPDQVTLQRVVEEAAARLGAACWDDSEQRLRAQSLSGLAERLFGDPTADRAVRGLMAARGFGEGWAGWFGARPPAVPSFRVHTFFRAIEGLFAPVLEEADESHSGRVGRPVGELSIDRSLRTIDGEARSLDLLYCESCGELFVGGLRRRNKNSDEVELLPTESDLESLPDASTSQRFEDHDFNSYAVFWPSDRESKPDAWKRARLDASTAVITPLGRRSGNGFLFSGDTHGPSRSDQSAGAHLPYECPHCETSYKRRQRGRMSPIRHFRPGFAKTTQLLASEFFDLLETQRRMRQGSLTGAGSTTKLVSFSDSRQEAARAAYDIEARHHEDLRREMLIALLETAKEARHPDRLRQRREELGRELKAAASDEKFELAAQLAAERDELDRWAADPRMGIDVGALIGRAEEPGKTGEDVPPLVAAFANKGVHPFDPAGIKWLGSAAEDDRWGPFQWTDLLDQSGETVVWRHISKPETEVRRAREKLLNEVRRTVSETLFNKTYFALEESGLGFVALPRAEGQPEAEWERDAALLRLFADAYRLRHSPFEDHDPDSWTDSDNLGSNNRVRVVLEAAVGDGWRDLVTGFIGRLTRTLHADGLIETDRVQIILVDGSDAYRCERCSRVHLHAGLGFCTRCGVPFNGPNETVDAVVSGNFLGRRVRRSGGQTFRLHAEELTGQTDNGPERQRLFRGVLIPKRSPKKNADGEIQYDEDDEIIYDEEDFWPSREEIDLLAVTTTMEVGIDIGPLQGVLQANMPPQRFNYQQRVGRAGRRGQAFSMAVTVCRTKSHDLHYFQDPKAMTGDVPPPPFLTRSQTDIARRFLHKKWLNDAFAAVRPDFSAWPADRMRPPDIHGEYCDKSDFHEIRERIRDALAASRGDIERFALVLSDRDVAIASELVPEVAEMMEMIDETVLREDLSPVALGHRLAEAGHLPMFGMPTRVRDLYTSFDKRASNGRGEWLSIDRDADVAVFEFAPGSSLIKDKRKHTSVGLTGRLQPPRNSTERITPQTDATLDEFAMARCSVCRAWNRQDLRRERACSGCGNVILIESWTNCVEPTAYRTDFQPKLVKEDELTARAARTVQAEGTLLVPTNSSTTNLAWHPDPSARTYRVNRGAPTSTIGASDQEESWSGYRFGRGPTSEFVRGRNQQEIQNQLIDLESAPPWLTSSVVAEEAVWLASAKTTDMLTLIPQRFGEGVDISGVDAPRSLARLSGDSLAAGLQRTATRSAALSATQLVVFKAAIHLDVDPEEFDIIEPRVVPLGEKKVPTLQFADFLVNGSGLTASLAAPGESAPLVEMLIRQILEDPASYPLMSFAQDDHRGSCGRACYRCLLRHSNQPLHGLLDWRNGLAWLHALIDDSAVLGLNGDWASPGLTDWETRVVKPAINSLGKRFRRAETEQFGQLTAVRFTEDGPWGLVIHPLWDRERPFGIVREALELMGERPVVLIDSFNLDRRPWTVRDAVERGGTPALSLLELGSPPESAFETKPAEISSTAPPVLSRTGEEILGHEVLDRISSGGFADAYEARHQLTGELRVLKIYRAGGSEDSAIREYRVRDLPRHENVLRILSADSVRDDVIVVSELIEGVALDEQLRRGDLENPLQALSVTHQILKALSHLHPDEKRIEELLQLKRGRALDEAGQAELERLQSSGFVHRDVKPANVVVHPERGAVLIDFNTASLVGDRKVTMSYTPGYAPPAESDIDTWETDVDLFAVGVTLFSLLTAGGMPYVGDPALDATPESLRSARTDVSEELEAFVLKACAPRSRDRFKTAEEMIEALQSLPDWEA